MERFRINESAIVHESIDGEVVIINLETGTYYSLQGAASDAWEALASPVGVSDITAMVCKRYEADPEEVARDVERFLDELRSDDLLIADSSSAGVSADTSQSTSGQRRAYEPIQLQKFTDMTHLLLLDPIHDVDEQVGWPIQRQEAV